MALIELPSVSSPRSRMPRPPPATCGRTIVVVRGEHDISTVAVLAAEVARAIGSADADLTLDLSEVRFMDASTVNVILLARQFLLDHQHTLTLRSPSRCAARVIDVCRLQDLLDPPAFALVS